MKKERDYFGIFFLTVCGILLVILTVTLIAEVYCLISGDCNTCDCYVIGTKNKWSD